MYILGISAYYHDSAACLVRDGEIIIAAQEERFTRKKHDYRFPKQAIAYCIKEAGISPKDIHLVAFYDKPFLKFERILETYLHYAPLGIRSFFKAMPLWLKEKLWIKDIIAKELEGYDGDILFPEHHQSHAASAFYPSPFQQAAFLTLDGVGEWTTTSYGFGKNNTIDILGEIKFPHSIGLLYSAFTYYLGFKVNSGEYKVMGLAPYGEPKYVDTILNELIDLKADGSFKLNMKYFNYAAGLTMTNHRYNKLFGGPPRKPESDLTQREMDIARSIQEVTNEVILRIAKHIKKETGENNICLAGGVALNCVANGILSREKIFDRIWIQPAAGDAGGALGAALFAWYQYLGNNRVAGQEDAQKGSLLGPEFADEVIQEYLEKNGIAFERYSDDILIEKTADMLASEKVVGWFQGRMEFGPRALGARSILGDARSKNMQSKINLKIKFRESFRPFAPSVLEEKVSDYFEFEGESPYMLLIANVKKELRKEIPEDQKALLGIDKLKILRSDIPAVTHVDYSARLQTVNTKSNPKYYAFLKKFDEKYNCGVVVNTSFNVRGEPIVCTPEDAYHCFMKTDMDYLVIGNFILDKTKQSNMKNISESKEGVEQD